MKHCNGSLIWTGGLSGLLTGWSSVALALWFCSWILRFDGSFLLVPLVGLLVLLPAFPIGGFAMGMACAFFWHSVAAQEQRDEWRLGVLMVFFLPLFWLGIVGGIAAICLLAPLTVKQFHRGLETGLTWWPRRRWRHFVGLANEWEREENER